MNAVELKDLGDGQFSIAGDLTFETSGDMLDRGQKAFEEHSRVTVDLDGVTSRCCSNG